MFDLQSFKASIKKVLSIPVAHEKLNQAIDQIEALTKENAALKQQLSQAATQTQTAVKSGSGRIITRIQ